MVTLRGQSIWLTLEGWLLIGLGVLALFSPLFAGLAAAMVFGWLLVMVGVVGLVSGFAGRQRLHAGWALASAGVALMAGLVLVIFPLVAAAGLAILIGAYLLLDGLTLIGLALNTRKGGSGRWGWILASGLLDLVLAAIVLTLTAVGSTLLLGFVIGLDLIATGIALLVFHRIDPTGLTASA
jgi:uncharacterized membrane protein HdeD (DUF308 family)